MTPSSHGLQPFSSRSEFSSLKKTHTMPVARRLSGLLLLTFVLSPIALMFVPWQQTVRGRGQVIAYSPTERKQVVTARVGGQIGKWHVMEGSRVKVGDPIVDIVDNDADMAMRLDAQREFLLSRRQAAEEEMAEQARAVAAQEKALSAAISAARANRDAAALSVDVARQAKSNTEFTQVFEQRRYEMYDRLYADKEFGGLESELNRDEARMRFDKAATDVKRADVELKRAEAALLTSESLVLQAEATGLSTVATTRRDLHKAQQNVHSIDRELQELDNRIERFKARFVKSPADGVVFRISANVGEGGQYVKEGDDLAVIVPDATERVVELMIAGVDAPLIAAQMEKTGEGPHVRLQFEGWPGVQFSGWPSVAVGTFGGKVRQMDPTDDGNGRFRILVEPDPMFDNDQWPDGVYLRQGNQAVGWVFLNQVTLGYELWRQFNGFSPVVDSKPPQKKEGSKPPKVKAG